MTGRRVSGEGTLSLEGSGEARHPRTAFHSLLLWQLEANVGLVTLFVRETLVHARSGEMQFLRQVWVREGSNPKSDTFGLRILAATQSI